MHLISEILGEVSSERPEYDIEQVAKRLAGIWCTYLFRMKSTDI